MFVSNLNLLSVRMCVFIGRPSRSWSFRGTRVCLSPRQSLLTVVMSHHPSLSACLCELCVLDRWMMYYVKQSDPNNGLLSCLPPLTSTTITHTYTDTQKHTHFHSHTLLLTHTHRESLDSLSVIELWRGSAVTTSITHPGEGWREIERKAN